MALQLMVVSGASGKAVLTEALMSGSTLNAASGLLWQRVRPVATIDGMLLVPDGRQLRCYRSAAKPAGAPPKEKEE
jgi:hypothetical protein